jgi:FkbM family methyltransferase
MSKLLHRVAAGLGRRVVRRAATSAWWQQRAWELITARQQLNEADSGAFLAYCAAHSGQSHAQLCQDLWVLWETAGARNGFFVEFGATNGVSISNTCLLEKSYGWQGILAEPFSVWHRELAANRSARIDHRCVWKESGQQLEFLATAASPEYAGLAMRASADLYGPARSNSGQTTLVNTVSLNDLLREHGAPAHIDFLSIDTEGSEFDILEAFDFSNFRVDLIAVEHAYDRKRRGALQGLLERNGFVRRFERLSQWDDWYASRAFLERRGDTRSPPML